MFLNKTAYLTSQGELQGFPDVDFSCFPCHIYNRIIIELTTPLIGCINCCLRLLFLDQLIQALLQRLKQCVFLTLCNVLCRK